MFTLLKYNISTFFFSFFSHEFFKLYLLRIFSLNLQHDHLQAFLTYFYVVCHLPYIFTSAVLCINCLRLSFVLYFKPLFSHYYFVEHLHPLLLALLFLHSYFFLLIIVIVIVIVAVYPC